MEFPFGHNHNRHRRDDDIDVDDEPPRFAPPSHPSYSDDRRPEYGDNAYGQPGYPPVQHLSHERPPPSSGEYGYGREEAHHRPISHEPPPPAAGEYGYGREESHQRPGGFGFGREETHHRPFSHEPPPPAVAGEYGYGREESHHRPFSHDAPPPATGGYGREEPHHRLFSSSNRVGHERVDEGGEVARKATVRVFTKADEGYSLTIRDGKVVLAPANPRDEHQHWIKDMKYSTKVKDQEGLPSFALVNKVTGEAIKHSIGASHPVQLVPYRQDHFDESVLWTESNDTGQNFRCIRMVNNIDLNFDALHGDEDHGGVRDGTTIVLWEWLKGKNQRWKIVPY